MTSAGSVGGDERLRLFLALELPPAALDDLGAWGSTRLSGGRIVPREHLHVTLAFLGSRPAAELDAIVRVLRDAVAAGREPIVLEPTRWRETRSVGMLVLADHGGAATRLAARCQVGLEELGV
jgi:RNA 2',3'-cyclic 3'-phosphodiesterase